MRQLNFNVSGNAGTDVPYLRTFATPDVHHLGFFESPTRFIVMVESPDTGGAELFYQNGTKSLRVILPPSPGAWEAGAPPCQPPENPVPVSLVYTPVRETIFAEGDRFVTESGKQWTWIGHNDFPLRKRHMEGVDIRPTLRSRKAFGSNVVATLEMWFYGEKFWPDMYGNAYYDRIGAFDDLLRDEGFYWQPILLADAQVLCPTLSSQKRHVERFTAEIARRNVFAALGNEHQKNGFDPMDFTKPEGTSCLWSRGSGLTDAEPASPGWDWKQWEGRRDDKAAFGSMDGYYVQRGFREGGQVYDRPMPTAQTEPIGFWDRNVPGRRSNDPWLAVVVAGTSRYYMRGANFHCEESLSASPWSEGTQACARAFFKELQG